MKQVIDQEVLLRTLVATTTEVFSTMLFMEVKYIGMAAETRAPDLGIISLVGITGDWGGSGVFCCTPLLATVICARMLGTDLNTGGPSIHEETLDDVLNEEVLDVVAETTNMIIGNVKNGLEAFTGPLAISVPTVIHGRSFQFRNGCGSGGVALAFTAEDEPFEVRISLAPTSKQNPVRSRIPVSGVVQA